ncbi:MAG: hypothetical protein ACON3Z_07275 [Bradymonadia bacterium]
MKSERLAIFMFLAVAAAATTWFAIEFNAEGLSRNNATKMALTAGVFVFCLVWIKRPRTQRAQRAAVLSKNAKLLLTASSFILSGLAVLLSAQQATRGYPPLAPDSVIAQPEALPSDFYAITGHPVLDTTYSMQGSEGQHVLVPIKPYEGRILAMLESLPNKPVELRITGLLRDDVRSVQRGQNGGIDGPFLGLYRERMGLPAGTRIYFLDTSKRAGLTLTSVLMFLIPFYFGLLFAVQPVRRARG